MSPPFGRPGALGRGEAEDWGLTPYQLGVLTFALIGMTAIITLPSTLITYGGHESWLAPLLALPAGFVPLLLVYDLDRRLPNRTLTEQARVALGPLAGTIVGLLPVLFFASTLASTVREFSDLILYVALPRTPAVVTIGLMVVMPLCATRQGPEVVARFGEVLVPVGLLALGMILLVTTRDLRTVNILPIGAQGWGPLLQTSFSVASWYAETMLLGFLFPFRGRGRRASLTGAGLGFVLVGLSLSLATFWTLAIFGPVADRLRVALFEITRSGSIAEFLSHLDAVLIASWVAGGLVKIAVWLFAFCFALSQTLRLDDYRPLTVPAAAFAFLGAISWWESTSHLTTWLQRDWPFWGLGFGIGVPLVIWVATVVGSLRERRLSAPLHGDNHP